MFKHIVCLSLVGLLDSVRGDVCSYQKVRQIRTSTDCGLFGWASCTEYRSQVVTVSECCHLFNGTDCDEDMESCSSSPCENGGVCTNEPDGYHCECTVAWSGARCEINIVDCGDPGIIEHGSVLVPSTKYNEKAVYTCNEHYNMTAGDSEITCQMDFTWNGTKPTCTLINSCADNRCQNSATCVNGVGNYTCVCGPGWSGVNCEQDVQPPVLENCPVIIQRNATKRTLVVSWSRPVFTDPFDETIDITSNYPQPEFKFPWGDFTAQYVATKVNNGLSTECTFNISVRPTPCEELNIPQNGARICNGWKRDYGRVCMMVCKQNYTIPPNQSYDKLYVCAASGRWKFPGPMPDCSVAVDSGEERLIYHPQSLSPIVTSCNDQSALGSIRQYYIDVLTQSGDLAAYCHKYPAECHPENVDVTCG